MEHAPVPTFRCLSFNNDKAIGRIPVFLVGALSVLHMVATFRPYLIMLAAPVDVGHAARNHCIYLRPNSASLPVLFTLTKARPCRSPRWALISLCIIDSGARPPDLPLIHGRRSARSFAHAKRNSRSASVQANSIPTLCHAAPAGLACQM